MVYFISFISNKVKVFVNNNNTALSSSILYCAKYKMYIYYIHALKMYSFNDIISARPIKCPLESERSRPLHYIKMLICISHVLSFIMDSFL